MLSAARSTTPRNGVALEGARLYVNLFPCADCAGAIVQSGGVHCPPILTIGLCCAVSSKASVRRHRLHAPDRHARTRQNVRFSQMCFES
ncbi:hypothetical protein [Pseudaminobacter soli (ex Li et al. 2025)]|uniref:hypothetical protein n=1 Tax=Pseudaminobacter soli (ex Li et al. 2025) TaxID=1295366 RepID=UPI00247498CC|nr:hypothetical protein [Mesorhizobium soli]